MESDLKTPLTVPLVPNKLAEMDIMDYVTSVQSTTMKKENDLFFQVSFINNLKKIKKYMKVIGS